MELDLVGRKGPLTDAQKLYRLEKGLCMYCGEAGHFVQSCTKPGAIGGAQGYELEQKSTGPKLPFEMCYLLFMYENAKMSQV